METENSIAPNTRALNANVRVPSLISIGEKQKIIEARKATSKLLLESFKISIEEKKRKRLSKVSTMAPKKGSILSIQFFFRKDKIQWTKKGYAKNPLVSVFDNLSGILCRFFLISSMKYKCE